MVGSLSWSLNCYSVAHFLIWPCFFYLKGNWHQLEAAKISTPKPWTMSLSWSWFGGTVAVAGNRNPSLIKAEFLLTFSLWRACLQTTEPWRVSLAFSFPVTVEFFSARYVPFTIWFLRNFALRWQVYQGRNSPSGRRDPESCQTLAMERTESMVLEDCDIDVGIVDASFPSESMVLEVFDVDTVDASFPSGIWRTSTSTSWIRPSSFKIQDSIPILFILCRCSPQIWLTRPSTSRARRFPTLLAPLTQRIVICHLS